MQNEELQPVAEDAAFDVASPPSANSNSPKRSSSAAVHPSARGRLSLTSQQYDIEGDGVLDAAEQAMRDMDESNRGHLTNDKVYDIVKAQMDMQKQVFTMKKIVIGLGCFTVVLALSNFAVAWAAAVLAKDSKVDKESADMMTKDGQRMVGTKAKIPTYEVEVNQDNERLRRELGLYDVGADGTFTVTSIVAESIFDDCRDGSPDVRLKISCNNEVRYIYDLPCSSAELQGNKYTYGPNDEYTIKCSGGQNPTCAVTGTSIKKDTCSTVASFTGLSEGLACFEDGECASNYCFNATADLQTQGTCGYSSCPATYQETVMDPSQMIYHYCDDTKITSCSFSRICCPSDDATGYVESPGDNIDCINGRFEGYYTAGIRETCLSLTDPALTCAGYVQSLGTCGDKKCQFYETSITCPGDGCTCGNNQCDFIDGKPFPENYWNCPVDCPP